MADVFISFIHEEHRIAAAVQEVLQGILGEYLGSRVFLASDTGQVLAGELWLDRIREELTEAKVVVLMLSTESVSRPWINFEAGAAWLAGKALIPVCFGGLRKDSMPKPYSGIQGLNLPDDLDYLVQSVAGHLDRANALSVPVVYHNSRAFKTVAAAIAGKTHLSELDEPWAADMFGKPPSR